MPAPSRGLLALLLLQFCCSAATPLQVKSAAGCERAARAGGSHNRAPLGQPVG